MKIQSKPIFIPTARWWNSIQVAARLGRKDSWFNKYRAELEAQGFPKQDPLFKMWDSVAIERWIDQRSGISSHNFIASEEEQMLRAINGQN